MQMANRMDRHQLKSHVLIPEKSNERINGEMI